MALPHPFGIRTADDHEEPCYSNTTALRVLKDAGRDAVKAYILTRLAVASGGQLLLWEGGIEHSIVAARERFSYIEATIEQGDNNFNCAKWFRKNVGDRLTPEFHPTRGFTFLSKGKWILNTFPGFAFGELRPLATFSAETLAKVQMLKEHQRVVFCSANSVLFEHWQSWQAAVLLGRRTEVIYYLESAQGTGKSQIMNELFAKRVLGMSIAGMSDSWEPLLGTFNGELAGKTFFAFDDAPVSSGDWDKVYKKLKKTTDATLRIRDMHTAGRNVSATLNVCIMSQDTIRIEAGDRRMAYLTFDNTFSNSFAGTAFGMDKRAYYARLGAIVLEPEVAAAYAAYLVAWDASRPNVKLTDIPQVEARQDALEVGMSQGCVFLKEFFLKGRREISRYPSSRLNTEYDGWRRVQGYNKAKRAAVSKDINKAFGWRLRDAARLVVDGTHVSSRFYAETSAQLLVAYRVRGWWTADDELEVFGLDGDAEPEPEPAENADELLDRLDRHQAPPTPAPTPPQARVSPHATRGAREEEVAADDWGSGDEDEG